MKSDIPRTDWTIYISARVCVCVCVFLCVNVFLQWVYQGVPYLTVAEEKEYIAEAERKLNDDLPDIRIDEKEKQFVENAK